MMPDLIKLAAKSAVFKADFVIFVTAANKAAPTLIKIEAGFHEPSGG